MSSRENKKTQFQKLSSKYSNSANTFGFSIKRKSFKSSCYHYLYYSHLIFAFTEKIRHLLPKNTQTNIFESLDYKIVFKTNHAVSGLFHGCSQRLVKTEL